MIVQCRFSSPRFYIATWSQTCYISDRLGRRTKSAQIISKQFRTFADANGFVRGMMKKGIKVNIEPRG